MIDPNMRHLADLADLAAETAHRLRRNGVPIAIGSDIESTFSADMFAVTRITRCAAKSTAVRKNARRSE